MMNSVYYNNQMGMSQTYGMFGAMSVGGSMMSMQASPMIGMQAGAMMSIGNNLGMGWGGYAGGISGMAGMYGQMGMYGAMMGGGMSMPGPQSMGMVGMSGMGAMGVMDNTIEVAGTGMGKDKTYKMFPGELMAVNSVLTKKNNLKPEDMQTQLKERFGIDTELKKVDGKSTLVNKATGNTIMSDGNGNNIMDTGDMKLKEALKTVQEKFGINPEQFDKMYDRTQGGTGATTGMNTPMAGGIMGMQQGMGARGYGYPGMMGMGGYGMQGMGMGGYGMQGMGMQQGMAGYGIWGDPMWQNSVYGIFGGAMKYAGMYGGY